MYRAVLKTQPDRKLGALAAAGSEPAFEVIVQRYRRALLCYCQGRLRLSENRAEDVVQQAFMNAWGSLRSGTEVRELRPWLYRITHNQAVSMMRGSSSDEISINDLRGGLGSIAADETSRISPVDDVYEQQQLLRETLTAVAALPELQRQALVATAVEGLSYDQVADALNTSSDAVRGLVYRARNTLRTRAAVFLPWPLVLWAAGQGAQLGSDSLQQGISEAGLGGGSLGIGAVAVKGIVLLASSAAVMSSGIGAGLVSHSPARTSASTAGSLHSATSTTATRRGNTGQPAGGRVGDAARLSPGSGSGAPTRSGGGLPTHGGSGRGATVPAPGSRIQVSTEGTRRPGDAPSPASRGIKPTGRPSSSSQAAESRPQAQPLGGADFAQAAHSGDNPGSRGAPPDSTRGSAGRTAISPPTQMES